MREFFFCVGVLAVVVGAIGVVVIAFITISVNREMAKRDGKRG